MTNHSKLIGAFIGGIAGVLAQELDPVQLQALAMAFDGFMQEFGPIIGATAGTYLAPPNRVKLL